MYVTYTLLIVTYQFLIIYLTLPELVVDELPELLEPLELRELLPELDELPDDLFDDPELEDPEFDGETLLSLLVLVT